MDSAPYHPLYQYRKERRLTRQQLAHQIGCSTRTLARWEKGHYCPRLSFAVRAGQVTGLAVETLGAVAALPVAPLPAHAQTV